ncbi:MAG: hypothetical protein GXY82_10925 [Methanospirillum sp.]|nr:hypothetical protein [Methanospirillum sp.]
MDTSPETSVQVPTASLLPFDIVMRAPAGEGRAGRIPEDEVPPDHPAGRAQDGAWWSPSPGEGDA